MKHHQRPFCSNYLQNCSIQGLTCEEINSWIDEGGKMASLVRVRSHKW